MFFQLSHFHGFMQFAPLTPQSPPFPLLPSFQAVFTFQQHFSIISYPLNNFILSWPTMKLLLRWEKHEWPESHRDRRLRRAIPFPGDPRGRRVANAPLQPVQEYMNSRRLEEKRIRLLLSWYRERGNSPTTQLPRNRRQKKRLSSLSP